MSMTTDHLNILTISKTLAITIVYNSFYQVVQANHTIVHAVYQTTYMPPKKTPN